LIAFCTEQQAFPQWLAVATFRRGWALAAQGQREEGIAQMRQGLTAWDATGAQMGQSGFLASLAAAYGEMGKPAEGLPVVAEALDALQKTAEGIFESEVYRVKGDLLLAQAGHRRQAVRYREKTEEAEHCFVQAIAVAQKQQAKSLELRAVMSLARLWQQRGERKNAHRILAEIYGWFTEGFATGDLQDAKALLEE
jgi:predicted ATPase